MVPPMPRRVRTGPLALIVCACAAGLIAPASASAASTVGSSLAFNGLGAAQPGCSPLCTFIPTAVSGANPVTSPIDGVIVRWSANAADGMGLTSTVRLRVIDSPVPNQWVGVRSGPTQHTTAGFVTATFDLNPGLPIAAGDYIGVDTVRDNGSGTGSVLRTQPGSSVVIFTTPLPDGGAPQMDAPDAGFEAYVQAIVEPDADRDGFGDESQDQCPTAVGPQSCPASPAQPTGLRAKALKKCKKKRTKAKRKRCRKRAKKLPV
jgi:hypothetical protein